MDGEEETVREIEEIDREMEAHPLQSARRSIGGINTSHIIFFPLINGCHHKPDGTGERERECN